MRLIAFSTVGMTEAQTCMLVSESLSCCLTLNMLRLRCHIMTVGLFKFSIPSLELKKNFSTWENNI